MEWTKEEIIERANDLKYERKVISEIIAKAKKKGEPISHHLVVMQIITDETKELDKKLKAFSYTDEKGDSFSGDEKLTDPEGDFEREFTKRMKKHTRPITTKSELRPTFSHDDEKYDCETTGHIVGAIRAGTNHEVWFVYSRNTERLSGTEEHKFNFCGKCGEKLED